MKVRIEKELCSPVNGPKYHVVKVDEKTGEKELLKTFDGDIKEAARFAERKVDFDVLEVAYKENPHSFDSTGYSSTSSIHFDSNAAEPLTKDEVRKFVGMFNELFENDFGGEESQSVDNQVILICQEVIKRMKEEEENAKRGLCNS